MPTLLYFKLSVIGSEFDAASFFKEAMIVGARADISYKVVPQGYCKAYQRGNVGRWFSPVYNYFLKNPDRDPKTEDDPEHQWSVISEFLENYKSLRILIDRYRTDTTEVTFHLVYGVDENEEASGMYIPSAVISLLSGLDATISIGYISKELYFSSCARRDPVTGDLQRPTPSWIKPIF